MRGMSVTSQDFSVVFDARTAYDFLVTLEIEQVEEMDLLPDDRRWLLGARESLSPDRRRDLDELFGEGAAAYGSGIGAMVVALPEARTGAPVRSRPGGHRHRTIVREMLGEVIRDPEAAAQLERILDGAADEIEAFAARTGEHHCAAAETLLAAPGAAIDRIRGLFAEWLARYEEVEPRVQQIITRDIALREADRSLPAVELVERTTGGVRWLGEAGVSRVVLSPSYFARTGQLHLLGPRLAPVRLSRGRRGPRCHRRQCAAVGHDPSLPRARGRVRLRILRLLRDRDMYLTELAQALEVSKPTMKHHLTALRVAGLVTVTDLGAQTYYSLRKDRLSEAGDDLMRFLA
jgi:DNA-binding transcriptional ArsR family regulator